MALNALSVDVEEHFQVSAFANDIHPEDWGSIDSRVERNTHALLDLFDEHSCKATFFFLGRVAENVPHLVTEICNRGHELASHGYSHQLVYNQSQAVFREETHKSKVMLEDISQTEILGYRAASYSITKDSLWALDVLLEEGFTYDSSIFPVHHDRYGIPDAEKIPHKIACPGGGEISELPLSTLKLGPYRLPVAGGGYFRLFPYWFTRWALRRVNKVQAQDFVFYLHPWEIDPDQPRIETSAFSRFRHYNNLDICKDRLHCLLEDFEFTTCKNVLQRQNLL